MLSAHLLGTVLESAPDAIVIVDGSGRIEFANRQVTALLGYSNTETVGRAIESLIPERFHGVHSGHRQEYLANVRVRPMGVGHDLFARRKDGSEVPVEISLSPIRDGDRLLIAAAIRDVTERRKSQADIVEARKLADRASKAKSRFLAMASHDLRQPLQTLTLLNGTLRRTVLDSTAQEILRHEAQAIDAMTRLLNALLDISRIESGAIRPDIQDFTVVALFEELRAEFTAVAESKGLELRVEPVGVPTRSDPSLVGQILRNLLSNAIKYTERGRVALRCRTGAESLRIEVVDTGVGIAADELSRIYDEFFRGGGSRGTSEAGYGLGLSIVQRLVTLLGLRLDVSSQVGRGSVFALELPLGSQCVAPAARVATARTLPRRARAARILLVEDDPGVRDATRMLLSVEGYQIYTASSLAEALAMMRAHPDVDLLVTDYHLGRSETGVQVIAEARAIAGAALGVILITGDTSSMMRDLRVDHRLRAVSKPIDADTLIGHIEELLPT